MIKFINEDCTTGLSSLGQDSVDLIFADPPFNIGYSYDSYKDKLNYNDYLKWSEKWIQECRYVLKNTGSIWVAIGDEFAAELCVILKKYFKMRNWVIWHYTFGNNCKTKFSRCHTHLLYFVRSDEYTFNADDIRVESKRQRLSDKRANSKGKIPEDVWTISRVCGTFKERCGWHNCQMPLEILNRIILTSSNKGDLVVDPFSGSGTTAVACKKLGRNSVNFDISKNYCEKAEIRVKEIDVSGSTEK